LQQQQAQLAQRPQAQRLLSPGRIPARLPTPAEHARLPTPAEQARQRALAEQARQRAQPQAHQHMVARQTPLQARSQIGFRR
jgi:hypothetical protein